ncbi:MAG: hypothetical protein HKN25_03570 [Pyrinomonadaceae bacterium]|nr:hypothetical protein [Pyrinomonadaceae bacterium]
MKYTGLSAIFVIAILTVFSAANVAAQYHVNPYLSQKYNFNSEVLTNKYFDALEKKNRVVKFVNPTIARFENGCDPANLKSERFVYGTPSAQKVQFCNAFQKVSNELNRTNWSPQLRAELEEIWKVFLNENVKIRPMKRGISKRIVLAAEPFTHGGSNFDFNASVYIRPKHIRSKSFFLLAMHELRHVYDFHRLWRTSSALPEAELEKRGFRIMGRIARETKKKEKLKRLPKVWKDSWRKYEQSVITGKMERTIEKFMRKSRFYKQRLRNPARYMVSFVNRRRAYENSQMASIPNGNVTARANRPATNTEGQVVDWDLDMPPRLVRRKPRKKRTEPAKENVAVLSAKQQAGRLPDPVKVDPPKTVAEPKQPSKPVGLKRAANKKNSRDLLAAAADNEKYLYYKSGNLAYEQDLQLQCWKKKKVTESYKRTRSIQRGPQGVPTYSDVKSTNIPLNGKTKFPSCLIDFDSIDSDATETFWSAAYLDEMPVKFEYFTKLNGIDVARYTVYKPAAALFKRLEAKYSEMSPFRVFVGTIFISVDDSQIIKFWGSSFPQSKTTGTDSRKNLANYNTTAVRQKLPSGIWMTTTVSTVAVSTKHGKAKPFSYLVKFNNYRSIDEDNK